MPLLIPAGTRCHVSSLRRFPSPKHDLVNSAIKTEKRNSNCAVVVLNCSLTMYNQNCIRFYTYSNNKTRGTFHKNCAINLPAFSLIVRFLSPFLANDRGSNLHTVCHVRRHSCICCSFISFSLFLFLFGSAIPSLVILSFVLCFHNLLFTHLTPPPFYSLLSSCFLIW